MTRLPWLRVVALSMTLVGCGDSLPGAGESTPDGSVRAEARATPADSAVEADGAPGKSEIDRAAELVEHAVEHAGPALLALEVLGILPSFECGEARAAFVEQAVEKLSIADGVLGSLSIKSGCLNVSLQPRDERTDAVVLDFHGGCTLLDRALSGEVSFVYAGGEDRTDVSVDLSKLQVDGEQIPVELGYGTCGDARRVWVRAEGPPASGGAPSFALDLSIAQRSGLPLVGSDTIVLDGDVSFVDGEGKHEATFEQLAFEVGARAPRSGKLTIVRPGGSTVEASFEDGLLHDKATVSIDGGSPVTVPLF